ncbi:PLDc N-terminal domain-containing protein [uncultured Amnibacterium sp.]|uniref:PLDc N-terminal domain-containing protein n=1 Tax=uncultured Amnibacterium sp. TaxID=1631851 RepID=UPI0035CA6B22
MARLALILAVVLVAVTVYSLVDWVTFDRRFVRGPVKLLWLPIILLIPVLGVALWFIVGRTPATARTMRRGPDDDPAFLSRVGSTPPPAPRPSPAERRRTDDADEIRRLEEELARTDTEDDGDPGRRGA